MLELIRQKAVSARSSALHNYLSDKQAFERASPGPAVQLIARDTFVAETSIKLEQLVIEVKSLGRDLQLVKGDISELRDEAARSQRFSEFIDREYKSRASKLDELSRRFDYLKSRFDAIDGNSKGDYQAFRDFESVSRRLTELGAVERSFRDVSKRLKISAALFLASIVGWMVMLFAS
ncbi:hypothetical protein [Hyphomicrobium sp.]|uniref:hypothetical protein n=1 Tax=Hyphomicrobium sp. TaxID=82 RepID=UPI002BA842D5|nr:hypothetical protein [Hyphomicrobium sp.]HRQ28250.1 hypothetical protein [Hyphomicrobium sp.]